MSKEPLEYLQHIRDESFFIISAITKDLSKDDFKTAFSANIPITHCTIGFGQWKIDKFGLFSRFMPFSHDINISEYQRSWFNAK